MNKLKNWYYNSAVYRYIFSAVANPINFIFCLKFPFWKSRNVFSGKFLGYSTTWYDQIPEGWQKAFGRQLSEELAETFIRLNIKKKYWNRCLTWSEIKEKWGELCLTAVSVDEIQQVLAKYEKMSADYCIECGKPAEYVSTGWVEYYCEDCIKPHIAEGKTADDYKIKNN